jgi:hypothetical protein
LPGHDRLARDSVNFTALMADSPPR